VFPLSGRSSARILAAVKWLTPDVAKRTKVGGNPVLIVLDVVESSVKSA
jgi:hypothetical protein